MPYYYVYRLDDEGHVTSRKNVGADADAQAVEKAHQWFDGHDIEVWHLDRKVAHLKHPN